MRLLVEMFSATAHPSLTAISDVIALGIEAWMDMMTIHLSALVNHGPSGLLADVLDLIASART